MEHTETPAGEIHAPYQWVVADETARLAIVPESALDQHKLCLQLDTGVTWRMATTSPITWVIGMAKGDPGTDGAPGADGAPGTPGMPGTPGAPGAGGASAYEIWLLNGGTGTEQDFLASLEGAAGADGAPGQGVPPGGTAGQVMKKASAADYDAVWQDPAAAAAEWGGITGLLSAQADLQAALSAKATPADISAAINALVAAAPGALDTLNELAAALGNDPNFATTMTAALAGKAASSHTHAGVYEPADATTAKTGLGQTFTRPQKAGTLALASGAAWDGSLATGAQHITVSVNGSTFTVANPSAQADGVIYLVAVNFVTANTIAWGSAFKGLAGITPTGTAGATDAFFFRSNGTNLVRVGYSLNGGA